ncbi:MAG: hypothetical protein MUF23_02050 [Pirellula sp.]|jgi:hypothetical protein|nr:hypothetical protein [Pirellula sp.]
MARVSWVQRLYWRYLSKPAAYRDLFLYAIDHPVGSILEIGIGDGERLRTLLPLCKPPAEVPQLRYAALDPFESAGASRMTLKGAYRLLHERGAKAHLIPGEPISGVMRVAHTVLPSDLVIIDGHWDNGTEAADVIAKWLPRLSHSRSAIFASQSEGGKLVRVATPAGLEVGVVQTKAA